MARGTQPITRPSCSPTTSLGRADVVAPRPRSCDASGGGWKTKTAPRRRSIARPKSWVGFSGRGRSSRPREYDERGRIVQMSSASGDAASAQASLSQLTTISRPQSWPRAAIHRAATVRPPSGGINVCVLSVTVPNPARRPALATQPTTRRQEGVGHTPSARRLHFIRSCKSLSRFAKRAGTATVPQRRVRLPRLWRDRRSAHRRALPSGVRA